MTMYGIDVSSAQAGMDTGGVAADFVVVKLTGGVGYLNPCAHDEITYAKNAGKRLAIYHYVGDNNPGTAQQEAAWFLKNLTPYLDSAVVLVMDFEEGGNPHIADSNYPVEFGQAVQSATGVRVVGYTDLAHLQYLVQAYNNGMPVWLAAYTLGYQIINGYVVPAGPIGNLLGVSPIMWQFTSSGHLAGWGGNLDLNVFYADGAAWDALCAVNGTVTPQGYTPTTPTPQEDELSAAEVDQIQGFINTAQTAIQKSIEVTQQYVHDLLVSTAYDVKTFDQKAGQDEGAIVINEVRANAAMLVAIAQKNAPAVAAAIPADIAKAVADELAKRLAGGTTN